MLFPTTSHPGRQRSSVSTAALGRPPRPRGPFVYSSNAGYARGTLRTLLVGGLRTFSGDDHAKMGYTPRTFRDNVLFPYHATLPGWPSRIRFCNLSGRGAPSPTEMLELIHLIRTGALRFEEATADDILAAQLDVASAVPGGSALGVRAAPLPNVARRDIGSRKPRFDEDGEVIPPRYERNGPKSAAWIDEEEDGDRDEEAVERGGLGPMTMRKDGFRCILEGGSWSLMDGADGEEEDPISDWSDSD